MKKFDRDSKNSGVGFVFLGLMLFGMSVTGAHAQNPAYNFPPPPSSSGSGKPDPASQPLVPESYYAIKLAETLQLPAADDPAKAEAQLSKLGIEPKNGWISEYPLTPAVLGEVDKGVLNASEQDKIGLDREQALKRVAALKTRLGFEINSQPHNLSMTGQGPTTSVSTIYSYTDKNGGKHFTDDFNSIPTEYRDQIKKINQTITTPAVSPATASAPAPNPAYLAGYYQNQGPPIITYYAPPPAYSYLYSWNPYPFWYTGYYFPGFYVLNDFHRQLAYEGGNFTVSHHAGPGAARAESINPAAGLPAGTLLNSGRQAGGGYYVNPAAENAARSIASQQLNPAFRNSAGSVTQARPVGAIEPMQSLNLGVINQVHSYQPSYMPQASITPYAPLITEEHRGGLGMQQHSFGGGMHGGRR